MEGLNTWRAQDYVSSSKTAEHFNRPRGILSTADMIDGNFFFYWQHESEAGKKTQVKNYSAELFFFFSLLGF
jgi:hypothetical protein